MRISKADWLFFELALPVEIALVFLAGLLTVFSKAMSIGAFVLVLSLMLLLLLGYGLMTTRPVVRVIVLSLSVSLLCLLGLALRAFGWVGGGNVFATVCMCDFSDSCGQVIAQCYAEHTAMAPPAWWPLTPPTPHGH